MEPEDFSAGRVPLFESAVDVMDLVKSEPGYDAKTRTEVMTAIAGLFFGASVAARLEYDRQTGQASSPASIALAISKQFAESMNRFSN